MIKRIALFVFANFLVLITISIVLSVLGVRHYITASGIDYGALMVFCLIWGFCGAFISLALSRVMAKWMMGVQVIDPQHPGAYTELVRMVTDLSRAAGLPAVPQIGVYQSPEVNAFATGPTKRRSLVAVSTGILQHMDRQELEGVIGHEIAHIQNGDMVTMTLLQGVLNAFVMFFSRAAAYAASQYVKEESRYMVHILVTIVLEILLGILSMMLVMWFSRKREFRADRGSAQYAGREKMLAALESLKRNSGLAIADEQPALATMKISGGRRSGFLAFFASHPPLDERIEALKKFA